MYTFDSTTTVQAERVIAERRRVAVLHKKEVVHVWLFFFLLKIVLQLTEGRFKGLTLIL